MQGDRIVSNKVHASALTVCVCPAHTEEGQRPHAIEQKTATLRQHVNSIHKRLIRSSEGIPSPALGGLLCYWLCAAALTRKAVRKLSTLPGGFKAGCLLRAAGARLSLTWRRRWQGLVHCGAIADYLSTARPVQALRLPVALLQLHCGRVSGGIGDSPARNHARSAARSEMCCFVEVVDRSKTAFERYTVGTIHNFD